MPAVNKELKESAVRQLSVPLLSVVGLLYLALFVPVFQRMVGQWVSDPNYSHGFLVPLVSAYLVWDRVGRLRALEIAPSAWGAGVLVGGLGLLLLGTLGAELFLQNLSTVVVVGGLVWLLLGSRFLRELAFPVAFLLFYVPLPAIVLNQVAFPLQLLAAQCAVLTLSGLGVPVLREGNIIELAGTTLEVAEACSGIRSLQALVALSTVFAYLAQKTLTKRLLLVMLSVPTAVAANVLRVSGTGLIAHFYGVDKAEGFYHSFASWMVFLVALALLASSNWVLARVGPARPTSPPSSTSTTKGGNT